MAPQSGHTKSSDIFRNADYQDHLVKWEGGVLQTYEDDIWVNQDSRWRQWVILDAMKHLSGGSLLVEGDRVSVIYHTPQHLDQSSSRRQWDDD